MGPPGPSPLAETGPTGFAPAALPWSHRDLASVSLGLTDSESEAAVAAGLRLSEPQADQSQ